MGPTIDDVTAAQMIREGRWLELPPGRTAEMVLRGLVNIEISSGGKVTVRPVGRQETSNG